jgi:hypothetical protein
MTLADVTGSGAASNVSGGAALTLIIPLALLLIVLAWWWLAARRGWPPLPTARHPAPPRHRWHRRPRRDHADE